MSLSPLLVVHVGAATVALLSGFAALSVRKGSRPHRRTGSVYFFAMLIMAGSALLLAVLKASKIDAMVAIFTLYFVATGWLTVERKAGAVGRWEYLLALVALGTCITAFKFGWQAAHGATGALQGMPAVGYFAFGSVALLVFGLDATLLIRGGVSGAHRLARHLWRSSFALLFTAISFFLPTRFELPSFLVTTRLNLLPVLFVAGSMVYGLYRVLFARSVTLAGAIPRESKNSPTLRTGHAPPTP